VAGSGIVKARIRPVDLTAPLTVRPMSRGDLPDVLDLERAVYPQPWSLHVFMDELALSNRRYVVVEDAAGSILGYGGLLLSDGDAHVTTVAVDDTARRHRIGTRIMLALVEAALTSGARHLTLEVRASNRGAQELYRRFGFAPVGVRKNYYKDEDAIVMWATDIDTRDYAERIGSLRSDVEKAP
jgi:ribosomal-protein-alanine N-acetyltransferase